MFVFHNPVSELQGIGYTGDAVFGYGALHFIDGMGTRIGPYNQFGHHVVVMNRNLHAFFHTVVNAYARALRHSVGA